MATIASLIGNRLFNAVKHATLLIFFVSFVQLAVAAPAADGPYVVQQSDGTWLARCVRNADSGTTEERKVAIGQTITVAAVGSVPAFDVVLRETPIVPPETITTEPNTPIFVVADTHGEFEILVTMLQKQGIIDSRLKWSFGSGRLVFLGDAFDRGTNQTEILWLIYKLEAEAKTAKGGVHFLLGNHEVMTMQGDLRYENPKYLRTADLLHVDRYSDLWDHHTLLGQWLRTKPVIIKINNLLCVHGGVSRAVLEAKLTLPQINASVRAALNKEPLIDRSTRQVVMGQLGPLWYRGYFADQKDFPSATDDDIEKVLEFHRAGAILVGHTIVEHVTPLYGGKVIAVQVYPHRDEVTLEPIFECVRVEHDRFFVAHIDGTKSALLAEK